MDNKRLECNKYKVLMTKIIYDKKTDDYVCLNYYYSFLSWRDIDKYIDKKIFQALRRMPV